MKIVTIVGARPQFIKASVLSRAIKDDGFFTEILVHTGQHYDTNMSDIFFSELGLDNPLYNLRIGGGSHGENTGRMIESLENLLLKIKPNLVLIYGDTDSTLAAALASVKLHIPIAHVEAGLRSFNKLMPEEVNRVLSDHISSLLFAPTVCAIENLINEGISKDKIHLVGDVMYDAALYYSRFAKKPDSVTTNDSFLLCTIHRAENTNNLDKLNIIVDSLNELAKDYTVILPIHPRTAKILNDSGLKLNSNICIIEPVGYLEMQWLLINSTIVITDSGGVQKEAYFHSKPCVTLRDETEWIELVEAGVNILNPPLNGTIVESVAKASMISFDSDNNIYGDGKAGIKIVNVLKNWFQNVQ